MIIIRKLNVITKKLLISLPLKIHRYRNHNRDFTLISRNCIGGVVYHQYGLQFKSPTINLFIKLDEFNYFCLYLREYINGIIKQKQVDGCDYPIGEIYPTNNKLPNISINFMHYKSFDEALEKWNQRKERINWENIYILNDCTTEGAEKLINNEIVNSFNKITYPKMIFVNKKYGFDGEYVMKANKNGLAHPLDKKKNSWKCEFNQFNFNRFFNANKP